MTKTTRLPIGTLINMLAVTIGSLIGMSLQNSFPQEMQEVVFQAIGLCVLLIGVMMSQKVPEGYLLLLIFSMLIGGVIGHFLGIANVLDALGDGLKNVLAIEEESFTEGLITTFLIFCIGSMTIVGAIEEGLVGNRELLLAKSLLDGITSIALASSYGIGVLCSIIPMFLFQGGITILASYAKDFFTRIMINMLSAVGGLLILGLGINILGMASIHVEDLLPAILVSALFTWFWENYGQLHKPAN